ncbi:uncharacterized protein ASPGLDRAFT_37623 [Aspergillus glaucus CBS 516.65]|uniref:Uncharacterized protein n=1 Tax=Aspergillus glaucus CBS 516.65 TaxID=1160497 RepID=A0A1L9VD20_ASPGL|nr:hypothetical protein ASPGLDRAFT_37623 [Aspergillus glaucus CBS 516.65]OJJ81799.1 hypothetical protein ASPGLDRAFT_37623 [Aspergillus glaucus CBS 516.65]
MTAPLPPLKQATPYKLNTTPLVDSESPLPTEPPTHPQPPSILFDNSQPADKTPSRLSGVKISKGAGQPSNTAATTLITKLATLLAVDEETIDPSATLASVRSGCLLLELVPWRWLDTRNHFVSVMDTMVWSRTQALAEFPVFLLIDVDESQALSAPKYGCLATSHHAHT